jgi:hypothetical protein
MVELQKKINSDDQVRAVGTGDSLTGFYVNRFGNRTLVVRFTSSLSLSLSLSLHTHTHIYMKSSSITVCLEILIYSEGERDIYAIFACSA